LSALTKLFVVLLIVCSLLLTAAVVVYVNLSAEWRTYSDDLKSQMDLLTRQKNDAMADAVAAKLREDKMGTEWSLSTAQLRTELSQARAELVAAKNEAAGLTTKRDMDAASIQSLGIALKTVQDNLNAVHKRNEGLIADLDKMKVESASTAAANTDYAKRLDATEAERRWLNEQVIQLQKDLATARNTLAEHRIPVEPPAVRSLSAPPVNGLVMEVKVTDGQAFATINIGSAEKVEKGMQFKVVNQGGTEFLANLTIDAVEPNEAWGRLEGPKVKQVSKDCRVLTQL
jgi:hypothetical protein